MQSSYTCACIGQTVAAEETRSLIGSMRGLKRSVNLDDGR